MSGGAEERGRREERGEMSGGAEERRRGGGRRARLWPGRYSIASTCSVHSLFEHIRGGQGHLVGEQFIFAAWTMVTHRSSATRGIRTSCGSNPRRCGAKEMRCRWTRHGRWTRQGLQHLFSPVRVMEPKEMRCR